MTEVCSTPRAKHDIDAHVWIGAFALAQIVITLVILSRIDALTDLAALSGLVQQKANGEIATMQQEIVALRKSEEALKGGAAKNDPAAPTRAEPAGAAPHGRARN